MCRPPGSRADLGDLAARRLHRGLPVKAQIPDPINLAGDGFLDPLPSTISQYVVGSEGTRHTSGMHRVEGIHQLEVEMWGGGVTGVADASEYVARLYCLAWRDHNRTGCEVRENGKDVAMPHKYVIAEERRQAIRAECHGVLEGQHRLAQRMDPSSLGNTIGSAHDLPIEWCVDLGSPRVALAGSYTDEKAAETPGRVVAEPAPRIDHEQVVCESLAEHVGAVARNAVAGRIDGDPPFTADGEVDDDRAIELVGHELHARSRQSSKGSGTRRIRSGTRQAGSLSG